MNLAILICSLLTISIAYAAYDDQDNSLDEYHPSISEPPQPVSPPKSPGFPPPDCRLGISSVFGENDEGCAKQEYEDIYQETLDSMPDAPLPELLHALSRVVQQRFGTSHEVIVSEADLVAFKSNYRGYNYCKRRGQKYHYLIYETPVQYNINDTRLEAYFDSFAYRDPLGWKGGPPGITDPRFRPPPPPVTRPPPPPPVTRPPPPPPPPRPPPPPVAPRPQPAPAAPVYSEELPPPVTRPPPPPPPPRPVTPRPQPAPIAPVYSAEPPPPITRPAPRPLPPVAPRPQPAISAPVYSDEPSQQLSAYREGPPTYDAPMQYRRTHVSKMHRRVKVMGVSTRVANRRNSLRKHWRRRVAVS